MSLVFNHIPVEISRTLTLRARQERRTVEEVAIAALERGLAFTEEEGLEGETWMDDPTFDEALRAFAEMDEEEKRRPGVN